MQKLKKKYSSEEHSSKYHRSSERKEHSTSQRDVKQFFQIFDFTHELCKKRRSQSNFEDFHFSLTAKNNINN